MTENSIVLTGFMGTGKTSIGRLLAARTGRAFVDTDEVIAQRAGKPIAAIFAEEGEDVFRLQEARLAKELAGRPSLVIATGGGLMLAPQNAVLAQGNLVLCLTAPPQEIWRRLSQDGTRRPLLETADPLGRIQELLAARAAGYSQFPQIDTAGQSTTQLVDRLLQRFSLDGGRTRRLESVTQLTVTHPGGSYPVLVGPHLLERLQQQAEVGEGTIALITDSNVGPLYAPLVENAACVLTIPAGEKHKHLDTVRTLYEQLLAAGIDRQSTVVALGGGVVGDVAGFVAATYMRGVRLLQCPTTLLAMVDASVGGKTGVDLPQGKNLAGAFKQPAAVVADVSTLLTLPPAEFAAGMAEVVKHGLIARPALFQTLHEGNWRVPELSPARLSELERLIAQAIEVKRDIVQEDPYERGRRALLNLGHTFAHAVEQVSEYRVRHGEAVAMGVVAAAHLSSALGYCSPKLQETIEALLSTLQLPGRIPRGLDPQALYEAMGSDKKKAKGSLRFILLRDIGEPFIAEDVPERAVIDTLEAVTA